MILGESPGPCIFAIRRQIPATHPDVLFVYVCARGKGGGGLAAVVWRAAKRDTSNFYTIRYKLYIYASITAKIE